MIDLAIEKMRDQSQADLLSKTSKQYSSSLQKKRTAARLFTQDSIGGVTSKFVSRFASRDISKLVTDPVEIKIGALQKEVTDYLKERETHSYEKEEDIIKIPE